MLQHWRSSASSSSTLDKEELAHREQEAVIATEDNDILAMKEELSPTGKAASQENVVTSEEEEEEEENPCSTLTEKPKAKISSCNNHEGATGTGIGTGIEQSPSPADLGGRGLPSLNPFQRWGGGNRNWNPAVALSKGEEAGADVETVVTPSEAHQQQLGGLLQLVEHQSAEEKNKETPCERQTLEENSDQKIGKSTSESDQETTAATSVETTGSQQNSRLLFRPFQRWRAAPAPAEKEEESIAAIHNHPTPSDLDALQTEEDKAQSAKKNDEGNRGKATDSALGGDSCTSSREPCQKGAENVKEDSKEIASAAYANAYSASENDGKQTGGFSLNLFRRRRSGNNGDTSCVDRKTTGIEGESSEDAITNEKEDEEAATKQPLAKSETIQGLSEPPDNAITSSTLAEKMRKGAVAVVGGTLTTVGLVMIPLPTPMGCVVAGSGLSLLATEFESAKKLQQECAETLVNTRDNLIDTVERTIEDDGEGDTAESEAIKETEEDNGIVIEVSVDDEYFNDNDCFYYEEDESVKARRRQQQLEEQKRKATALQNYKKELSLKTRAYLATNVLPLLNKTKEFGASTNKTTDNDNTNAWSK